MTDVSECPWCGKSELFEGEHKGTNGIMKIIRCAQCQKLVSVRLKGEPDSIIRKN